MLSTPAFHVPLTARINPRRSRPLGLRRIISACRGASAYRSWVVRGVLFRI